MHHRALNRELGLGREHKGAGERPRGKEIPPGPPKAASVRTDSLGGLTAHTQENFRGTHIVGSFGH